MHEITIDELKKIQVEILDYVADYCKKNGIHYWLDCGTLLGAVRHKGYIPWDDDIDIGMLRDDYDKFISEFNQKKNNKRFKVTCIEEDSSFYVAFAKILDLNTVLYEPDEKGFKSCVNIDLFPYDNAPNDEKLLKQQFDKKCFYQHIYVIKTQKAKEYYKKPLSLLLHYFLIFVPNSYLIKKLIKNAKKYSNVDTGIIGSFSGFSRTTCNKNVYSSFIPIEFEGKEYPIPIGYDELLTEFYGDYMKLPPEEKRVTHHSFLAYYL